MYRFTNEIQQMMAVSGETRHPGASQATAQYIEDVLRMQLLSMLAQARKRRAKLAGNRGLTVEDVLFLIRKDPSQLRRATAYLYWKEVRKLSLDGGESLPENDEPPDMATIDAPEEASKLHASKKRANTLPWDLITVLGAGLTATDSAEQSEDEDNIELDTDSRKRLKRGDEATSSLSEEDYNYYAECRTASFVYRKAKRFRDFLGLETRDADEILDVLGLVAVEIVRNLTTEALSLKQITDSHLPSPTPVTAAPMSKDPSTSPGRYLDSAPPSRPPLGPFSPIPAPPKVEVVKQSPLDLQHVQDAYMRLENRKRSYGRAMSGRAGRKDLRSLV